MAWRRQDRPAAFSPGCESEGDSARVDGTCAARHLREGPQTHALPKIQKPQPFPHVVPVLAAQSRDRATVPIATRSSDDARSAGKAPCSAPNRLHVYRVQYLQG